jgi:transcriptional regulator with GAF, ATPase, and Fis domain
VHARAVLDLTDDLKELTRLAVQPRDMDSLLSRALDFLSDVIPYDLAAILELGEGDALKVLCARGPLASGKVKNHTVELGKVPGMRLALESRRVRVQKEHDHQEGDPYDGVLDLPHGHSCMVVPLYSGDRTLGAMTFDRAVCETYDRRAVDLVTIYGQIIALAMVAAEHAGLLERHSAHLVEERRLLLDEVHSESDATRLLAASKSPLINRLVTMAGQVANTDAPVLITGETGSGKELLARAIHQWSDRHRGSFVKLNCAALPEHLVESELFGHTKGAFTGAESDRPGRFQIANGGTLLLDEIGDLPLPAQAKLLRVLQEGTFEPVGSDRTIKIDVRIIAATHVDLEAAIANGSFRQDLYYRLNVFPMEMPALRARIEDLPVLVEQHLEALKKRTGRGPWTLGKAAIERLSAYEWPGNVRELINALERATILMPKGELDLELPRSKRSRPRLLEAGGGPEAMPTFSAMERDYFERLLEGTQGKIYGPGGAASIADMKPSTLQSRLLKIGIKR